MSNFQLPESVRKLLIFLDVFYGISYSLNNLRFHESLFNLLKIGRIPMKTYRAAVIGCSRMGAFIDNEVPDYEAIKLPYSHAAGFFAEERTDLIACADLRPEVMEHFGNRYNVPKSNQYTDLS